MRKRWWYLAVTGTLLAACTSGGDPVMDAAPGADGASADVIGAAGSGQDAAVSETGADAQQPDEPTVDGDHSVRAVEVVGGLENPWGLAFLPSGDALITERAGRLRIVRGGALLPDAVAGTPAVAAQGQGGLLDVLPAPDFATTRTIYLSYAKPLGNGVATTAVARGRLDGDKLVDVADVFVADARSSGGAHFGSRLAFDPDGLLYISVGERGDMERAQRLSDHAGTVVRLRPDGQVPTTNPFVGRPDAKPEIFSYGHRNPQGMAVHPRTGQVWVNEHGPRGGDEINRLVPGANYGWPKTTYGVDYSGAPITENTELPGIEGPVLHWTPSIAPSGMVFYTGARFPHWRGNAFVGALAGMHLRRVVLDGARVVREQTLLGDLRARIRDVRQGPDGYLYILTDANPGMLMRIEPAS